MYCAHFGLHRPPFNNTPDPAFYYGTSEHEEALATLEYATVQRKGFVLVTGEVGAGKTLIGRMFLRRIESRAKTAVITHTQLSGKQLMAALCSELEIQVPADASNLQLAERLQAFLLEQYAHDRLVVVLLDEAQNLPDESFEAVRMLGNLEADDAKLIQICILGQPELRERFEQPSMRQLDQRLFRRYHLNALTREQTGDYVRHRLRAAGGNGAELFTEASLDRIFEVARGTPRLINRMCDNALLTAYGRRQKTVDAEVIDEIAGAPAAAPKAVPRARPRPWLDTAPADRPGDPARQQLEAIYGSAPELTEVAAAGPAVVRAQAVSQPAEHQAGAGEEVRGTVRPWLDASRSLADYRNHVQGAVDDVAARCDALQQQLEAHECATQALDQQTAQQFSALGAQIQQLEGRCASAAEVEWVQSECGTAAADVLKRISDQAEGLARLRQEFTEKAESMVIGRQDLADECARRLKGQVDRLRKLGRGVIQKQAGLQKRIESLAAQIARSGGQIEGLQEHIAARKSEIEALAQQVTGSTEGLGRELAELRESAATREDLEQARGEQTAALGGLREEQARAFADLQGDLARHESAIENLNRQVGERMGAVERALASVGNTAGPVPELEGLRAELSAALASADRRLAEESEALARLQQALHDQTGALAGEGRAAVEVLSRRILAQARRVRTLRQRLATVLSAVNGRLEDLGRDLSALREEAATRQELEQAWDQQSAVIECLKDEHTRNVAAIQDDLVRHESVVHDMGRQVRERMNAVEQALSMLRNASASTRDMEKLRGEYAAQLARMDRRLVDETEALAGLQQELAHQKATLKGDGQAVAQELSRRILAQARRVRDLRHRLGGLRSEVGQRLNLLGQEVAGLRDQMATRSDLERAAACQAEALSGVKDEQDRALAAIRSGLDSHERSVQELNRQVRERVSTLEQAVKSLSDTAATAQDVESLRTQQSSALEDVGRRLAEESEALNRLQRSVEERAGALSSEQQAVREELSQRILRQARWVRDLRDRLARMQMALEGRLNVLAGDVREGARMLGELSARLDQRESELRTLNEQTDARFESLTNALEAQREQSATRQDLGHVREELVGFRLATQAQSNEMLSRLEQQHETTNRQEGQLRDLHVEMTEKGRTLADLGAALGRHDREIHDLAEGVERRFVEAAQALDAVRSQAAGRDDLERARSEHANALADIVQRLTGQAERLRLVKEEVDLQSANASREQQAACRQLARQIDAQARRVRGLHRRLLEGRQSLEARLNEMEARFAGRSELESLRTATEDCSAKLRERLEHQRELTQELIDGVVRRCRAVQERLDAVAGAKADAGDLARMGERQEQAAAQLLERLEQQKGAVQTQFDEVLAHWQQTQAELARLAAIAAPAEKLAALAERQEQDTRRMLAALACQRGELESLLEDVNRRCEAIAARLDALPRDLVDADRLEAMRREHAEQIHSICERMDTGRSQIDAALRDVAERCRQALEQIEILASRAATNDDVAAIRETHVRDLGAVLDRLDHNDDEHKRELNDFNQRWEELAHGVQALAAFTTPPTSIMALEESLAELRDRVDRDRRRRQDDMRSLVRTVQQLSGRLSAVEGIAPVTIKLSPEGGRELNTLIEQARAEREELARMAETAASARLELVRTAGRVEGSLQGWNEGAAAIDEKSGELRASVGAAGKLLKAMQRAQQILDERLNSPQWQAELAHGESLAARLERAVGEAGSACGRLQETLRQFDACRDNADAWTARCAEARRVADDLAKLLSAGKQAGQKLESELSHRKRVLNAVARNTAGLMEAIEAARRADEAIMGRVQTDTRLEASIASADRAVSRIEWPRVPSPADRLTQNTLIPASR